MTGLLALINLPARAQDKPDAPPSSPPPAHPEKRDAPVPPAAHERAHGDMHPVRPPDREIGKTVAYIGLLTDPVSDDLRAQFNLQEGFGLQVIEVMPSSPAQTAGLKAHDVLLNFEDQKLVNMDQLQTLVRSKKKDDSVNLLVLSGGERKTVQVTLGERVAQVGDSRGRSFMMPGMPSENRFFDRRSGSSRGPDEWRNQAEQFQDRIREYQKRMEDWTREGRKGTMPPPPMFEGPRGGAGPDNDNHRREGDRGGNDRNGPRDGESRRPAPDGPRDTPQRPGNEQGSTHRTEHREINESASITRSDETGIYSLQKSGEQATFSVTPKDGEAKSWPVGTEDQRAAVPEPYRTKLREMEEIRSSVHRDGERAREGAPPQNPPPTKRGDGI